MTVTTFSRSDLPPRRCGKCGTLLSGDDAGIAFVCLACGLVHEATDGGFEATVPLVCLPTTRLAVTGDVHHLAVWRLLVEAEAPSDPTWEQIVAKAGAGLPYLYVPAFTSARSVVHRLGFRLTEVQPALEAAGHEHLSAQPPTLQQGQLLGTTEARPSLPRLAVVPEVGLDLSSGPFGKELGGSDGDASGLSLFSPVLVCRQDACELSQFIYESLRFGDVRELGVVDHRLDVLSENLVYIPAVWDERCIHDANWRLLLREFDGLVA